MVPTPLSLSLISSINKNQIVPNNWSTCKMRLLQKSTPLAVPPEADSTVPPVIVVGRAATAASDSQWPGSMGSPFRYIATMAHPSPWQGGTRGRWGESAPSAISHFALSTVHRTTFSNGEGARVGLRAGDVAALAFLAGTLAGARFAGDVPRSLLLPFGSLVPSVGSATIGNHRW
jgi:hypothetical protein